MALEQAKTYQYARRTQFTLGLRVVGSLLGFLSQMYFARVLGAEEFGRAGYILGLVGLLQIVQTLGISTYLVREVAAHPRSSAGIFSAAVLTLALSFIIVVPVSTPVVSKLLAFNGFGPAAIIMVMALVLAAIPAMLVATYYIALHEQQKAAFCEALLTPLLRLGFFFVLILVLGKGYQAYLLAVLASGMVFAPIMLRWLTKPTLTVGNVVVGAWRFAAISMLYAFYNHFSRVLQGLYSSEAIVGTLSLGLVISQAFNMLGSVLAQMAMPEFAALWKSGNRPQLKALFQTTTRVNSFIVLPVLCFFILNAKRIMLMFGPSYANGTLVVVMLAVSQAFNSFVGPNGTLLNMTRHEKYELINGVVQVAVGLALGLTLGRVYDWGIALSAAVALVITNLLKTVQVGLMFQIWPMNRSTTRYILIVTVLQTVILLAGSLIPNVWLWLLVNGLMVIGILVGNFWFSPVEADRKAVYTMLFSVRQLLLGTR